MTQSATGVKLEDIALGGISQSQKDKLRFRLHRPLEESHAETESRCWAPGQRGRGGALFNGNVLRTDGEG